MRSRPLHILLTIFLAGVLSGCSGTRNIPYFQDVQDDRIYSYNPGDVITAQPDDKLQIMVKSKDQDLTNMLNLYYGGKRIGQQVQNQNMANQSQTIVGYIVDKQGCIEFPAIGSLSVMGKTRGEIAAFIKEQIISNGIASDPSVQVDFLNMRVSVMGEVARPGVYRMDRENYTILDAISDAGDLTIFGRREAVTVVRRSRNGQGTYNVDLTSLEKLAKSPVYYLRQDDIIYIEPNNVRARQATVNGNAIMGTSFWISLSSLFFSIARIFI